MNNSRGKWESRRRFRLTGAYARRKPLAGSLPERNDDFVAAKQPQLILRRLSRDFWILSNSIRTLLDPRVG